MTRKFGLALLLALFSINLEAQRRSSGADEEEGWIVRRTEDGVVKVPRRQKFRFEGVDVSGDVDRPAQSALGARSPRRDTSLIPVRSSFREEFLGVSGLQER